MPAGLPDFVRNVRPYRAILGEGQYVFKFWYSDYIPAWSLLTIDVYTVPTGYRFFPIVFIVACDNPVVQEAALLYDGSYYANFYFVSSKDVVFTDAGSFPMTAGDKLQIKLWNWDDHTNLFKAVVSGILERVG